MCNWEKNGEDLPTEGEKVETKTDTNEPRKFYSVIYFYAISFWLTAACMCVGQLIRFSCVLCTQQCPDNLDDEWESLCFEHKDGDWFMDPGRGFAVFINIPILCWIRWTVVREFRLYKERLQVEKDEWLRYRFPYTPMVIFALPGTFYLYWTVTHFIQMINQSPYSCNEFFNQINIQVYFPLMTGLWYIATWNHYVLVTQALAEREMKNKIDVDKTALLA